MVLIIKMRRDHRRDREEPHRERKIEPKRPEEGMKEERKGE